MARANPSVSVQAMSENSDLIRRYCPMLAVDIQAQIAAHIVPDVNTCWPWDGYIKPDGHGAVSCEPTAYGSPQSVVTHRHMYEQLVGPIPYGYHIHHRCEVKPCWNLFHLQALTPKEHAAAHREPAPLWKPSRQPIASPVVAEVSIPAPPRKRNGDPTRPRRQHAGRPCTLTPAQQALVLRAMEDLNTNVTQLAEALGVHRSTIYRALARKDKQPRLL